MLSSLDIVVKRMSYESCCDVLRKALKHSHVTNPMSNHCNKALFMIDQDVLHVLSAFGMADEDEKVRWLPSVQKYETSTAQATIW